MIGALENPHNLAFDYSDAPTIAEFSESTAFVRGLMGPFGSGKSSGCVIELPKSVNRQRMQHDGKRRARYAVIRNTYRQLEDTTIRTVHDWLPPALYGEWLKTDHILKITRLHPEWDFEIIFRALDRPDHVANLLSMELTGAWVNEAREVPWAIIEALQGRVGRYPSEIHGGCVDPFIILDTNPPDDDSWFYRKFEIEKPAGWELFKQPGGFSEYAENTRNLPKGYYERMRSMDPESQKVYIHGQYGVLREGKPVYPDYNDTIHCVDIEPTIGWPIEAGWDFGLTPALALAQVSPTGHVNIFAEYVGDGLYFADFCDEVLRRVDEDFGYLMTQPMLAKGTPLLTQIACHTGDPSGEATNAVVKDKDEATCFAIAKGRGIKITGGQQGILTRIGAVAHALTRMYKGRALLSVHSRCKVLRRGFMGRYSFRKILVSGSEPRYEEQPYKNSYSHIQDAVQYLAAKLFGHLIRNIEEHRTGKRKPLVIPSIGVR